MAPSATVPSRLQIHDPRERALVWAADRLLTAGAAIRSTFTRRRVPPAAPERILLLRLERIGDLLMALPAIADVRALAPGAVIDLVVGSWNSDLAGAISGVSSVKVLDAAWLAREKQGLGPAAMLRAARAWRPERYDLAINFEPDIRSNLLLAASGSGWTAGYRNGGGAPLIDLALDYDVRAHTTDNARRLVASAFGRVPRPRLERTLSIPSSVRAAAATRLGGASGPLVGVHVSGGRAIKQWDPERFAEVALRLTAATAATIVLTGSDGDRVLVDRVAAALPRDRVLDVAGSLDLLNVAAIIERLDLLVTGDTGPMHLAAAVGTPIVAVFGPSDPSRYAPRGPRDIVVRVDLPCSPCNRIRLPPARCVGHTPDCLASVDADSVFAAAMSILAAPREEAPLSSAAV
jgi:lipopolysaccharide heptosyltransferase II